MTREERRHRISTIQNAIERHYRAIHELEDALEPLIKKDWEDQNATERHKRAIHALEEELNPFLKEAWEDHIDAFQKKIKKKG